MYSIYYRGTDLRQVDVRDDDTVKGTGRLLGRLLGIPTGMILVFEIVAFVAAIRLPRHGPLRDADRFLRTGRGGFAPWRYALARLYH